MSSLLEEILATKTVSDGVNSYELHSNIDSAEGAMIQTIISDLKPQQSIEIGMAYGVSTLFICEAISAYSKDFEHVAVDPNQSTDSRSIGRLNVERAGYASNVKVIEEPSEFVLPRLAAEGKRFDFALIDGWHTFDHELIDFFYINRMLNVGGICVFDDYHMPSTHKLVEYVKGYPAYELYAKTDALQTIGRVLARGPVAVFQTALRHIGKFGIGGIARTSMMAAVRKVAEDERDWDWYSKF